MRKRKRLIVIAVLLATYIGSYLWLSRRGYAEADQFGMKGFYYVFPEESDTWFDKNYGCVYLYYPLNVVDQAMGTGRGPGAVPLFHLGGGKVPAK